jgi:hypothetical protein
MSWPPPGDDHGTHTAAAGHRKTSAATSPTGKVYGVGSLSLLCQNLSGDPERRGVSGVWGSDNEMRFL